MRCLLLGYSLRRNLYSRTAENSAASSLKMRAISAVSSATSKALPSALLDMGASRTTRRYAAITVSYCWRVRACSGSARRASRCDSALSNWFSAHPCERWILACANALVNRIQMMAASCRVREPRTSSHTSPPAREALCLPSTLFNSRPVFFVLEDV